MPKRKPHRNKKLVVDQWTVTLYGPADRNEDDEIVLYRDLRLQVRNTLNFAIDKLNLPEGYRVVVYNE